MTVLALTGGGVGVAGIAMLTGCEKKAPPPPPPPPPPAPVTPPAPEPVTVSKVLSDLKPDPRVQFPQEVAPVDEELARAVVNLANAVAKGDSDALRDMLSGEAQVTLDGLVNSGEWDEATSKIEGVRVLRIRDNAPTGNQAMNDATVWLAVQEPGSAYVMGWSARNASGSWKFDGAAATNAVKPRAQDFAGLGDSELTAVVASSSPAPKAAANDPLAGMMMGNLAALASLTETQLVVMYVTSEVIKKLGMPVPPLPAEVQTANNKGKAAFDAGKRPDAAALKALVQSLEAPGRTRDEIIVALASVLGMDKAALEAMLGSGAAPAPKPAPSVGG
ncbi:MAG TPA: hypothetical protein VK157_08465 [Phycisphaerales bacterium]|nr:hypothetical protein [Phycisphaerales bacterium]